MKIFISYGHNDYTQLVDRLFDAMIEAGHEPWKDDRYEGSSGIAPGQDFTEVIYKAIDASDFVIAFVTRCTQEKPYCRDERQYAYNKKGTHFIQIRMDNVEITLGNARSYIDMSDTVDSSGRIYEKLFENNLQAIFAAFRDPMSFAEGGITPWTKIDTHLKVPGSLKYHDFIGTLDQGDFVGRQWLLNRCRDWAMDDTIARRLFVIFGEAGTGKTAFIRHLSRDEKLVRSVHVCIYDRPSTRTVRDTLKDLAYVLAHRCDDYYNFLKSENLEKLKDMTEDGMFEFLFLDPLKDVKEKYLLIIDGLDELEETSGLKPLMRIFRQYAHRIHPNISFLVTTRPDETITDLIKTVGKGQTLNSITLSRDANREDLQLYIDRKLRELGRYDEALGKNILNACDGNFEYLSLLFKEAAEEDLSVSEDMPLPRGLNERYIQYLDRRMDIRDQNRLSKPQRQLLALLCVGREPLPLSLLADVTDMDEYDVLDELEVFGSMIHRSDDPDPQISLFTKGFRDFLLSKECRRYSADRNTGTKLLAQYMTEHIRKEKDLAKHPYLDRNGFVHLLQYAADEPGEVTAYINQLSKTGMDTVKKIADALCMDADGSVRAYFDIYSTAELHHSVIQYLKENHADAVLHKISQLHLEIGDTFTHLNLEAELMLRDPSTENDMQLEQTFLDILGVCENDYRKDPCFEFAHDYLICFINLGDVADRKDTVSGTEQAKQWYQKALELAQQNYREHPGFLSNWDLSVCYTRLGSIADDEGNQKLALEWFRKALEVDQKNYRDNPCYESRRSLSCIYSLLGNLALTEEDPDQARIWYTKALELNQENYRAKDCFESRRNLSTIYIKLGNLDFAADKSDQAMQWYQKALELSLKNNQDNPGYVSRRNLAITYTNLGKLIKTSEDSDQALAYFMKALDLYQQNHRENPCYSTREDLASAFKALGDFAKADDSEAHFSQAWQWHLKLLELNQQLYLEKPCFDSRFSLSVTYNTLGSLAMEADTQSDIEKAKQWFLNALELGQQNYQEDPCLASMIELSFTYTKLAYLAEENGTAEDLAQARKWCSQALELDQKIYLEDPCFENRESYSLTLTQLGELIAKNGTPEDLAQAKQYLLEALELTEQNHSEKPCYRNLADAYSALTDLAEKDGSEESLDQARQWYLKQLELNQKLYQEDPCYDNRVDLAINYKDLTFLAQKTGFREGYLQPLEWHLAALELEQQNYREVPDYENRRTLIMTHNILGVLFAKSGEADGPVRMEEHLRESVKLCEENHKENPCYESRHDLAIALIRLSDIAVKKGTEEDLSQAEQLLLQALALNEQSYEEEPCFKTRRSVSLVCDKLSNIAVKRGTDEDLKQALHWICQVSELDRQNYEEVPTLQNRRILGISFRRYGILTMQTDSPEELSQALDLFKTSMELLKENHLESPSGKSKKDLAVSYELLSALAEQINTPESLAEAAKWDALRQELEAQEG